MAGGGMSVHDPDMHPFRVDIEDAALDDLRVRLERTRFATPTPGPPGQAGISPDYLRELVDYWPSCSAVPCRGLPAP
ncbi:MAG TPA: epoxide hydrolase N-terminal domain-containing protein [Actinomycetota bacterium]|nr:epoxide hydrolase N-terminal domain-containing protein [Actinomycetota bacterium]